MGNLLNLVKPFWLVIVKYTAIIGGVLLVLLRVRQSGTQAEQRREAMETLKAVRTREKIEDVVTSATNPDKLLKKYMRD